MSTDLANSLVAKYFAHSGKELLVGGIPITDLASEFGTPLYMYDRDVIDRKLNELRAALPPRFAIYYSIKANPNPTLVKHLVSQGCGLEIASSGELLRALEVGCPSQRILFAGPSKTQVELELAISHGIGEIHIESLSEARRVAEISRRRNVRTRVAIRVNPIGEAEGGAMRMGGRPAPFGVDEENLDDVLDAVMLDSALDLQGIHLFAGTQNLDARVLFNQFRHGLEVSRSVVKKIGHPLLSVDFGGGLGIPYFSHETELDLAELRDLLGALCASIHSEETFMGTQFILEPGRFLVGEAGIYVSRVNDIKISRGKKFLILDGGMNHHLAASGNLGQTIKRNYPMAILNRIGGPDEETVEVVGPLCTPLDMFGRGAVLPKAAIGDLVGIFQSGAYGLTASPVNFLSHPPPAEVLVKEGKPHLISALRQPHAAPEETCCR